MSALPEIELSITSPAGRLAGTLQLPVVRRPAPAVMLVSGSGRIDRNSDSRRMQLGIARQLARVLAAHGIASLRYDKRGIGQSTGAYFETGLHDNIDDAGAMLAALAARPEIDARRLFVLGHSEGAIIATALAARAGTSIAGAVLLAPPARRGADLLQWQAQQIAASLSAPLRFLLRLLRIDLATKAARQQAWLRRTRADAVKVAWVRINAKWFREFLDHDPALDLASMHCPVCAIGGDKDLQVDANDLARVAALVQAPTETHRLADLTHLLRSERGKASLRTYRQQARQPVEPEVVRIVIDWLQRQVAEPWCPAGLSSPADLAVGLVQQGCSPPK